VHLPVLIVVALQRSTSHFAPSLLLFSKSVSTKSWRIPDDRSPLLPARDLSPLLGFLYFPCYSILLKQRHLLSLTVVSNSTPSQLTPILFHLLSKLSSHAMIGSRDCVSLTCMEMQSHHCLVSRQMPWQPLLYLIMNIYCWRIPGVFWWINCNHKPISFLPIHIWRFISLNKHIVTIMNKRIWCFQKGRKWLGPLTSGGDD